MSLVIDFFFSFFLKQQPISERGVGIATAGGGRASSQQLAEQLGRGGDRECPEGEGRRCLGGSGRSSDRQEGDFGAHQLPARCPRPGRVRPELVGEQGRRQEHHSCGQRWVIE